MVSYTWTITRLDVRPSVNNLTNVVVGAHWILTGTKLYEDVNYAANCNGIISFDSPDENLFIPYDQITFDDTISWIQSHMGELQVSKLQEDLSQTIESRLIEIQNPPFINLPLPWENI